MNQFDLVCWFLENRHSFLFVLFHATAELTKNAIPAEKRIRVISVDPESGRFAEAEAVGFAVGFGVAVGLIVAETVAVAVGLIVGVAEAEAVGDGFNEGVAVGLIVGVEVGDADGVETKAGLSAAWTMKFLVIDCKTPFSSVHEIVILWTPSARDAGGDHFQLPVDPTVKFVV